MAGRLWPPRYRLAGGGAGARKQLKLSVMPGLVPGIHVFLLIPKDVDGRDKPGHDDGFDDAVRSQSKSPPAAIAVVPCSRNALITLRPTRHLCTSSGPSTSRCERTWVDHFASGASWLKPSAPCNWMPV